MIPPHLFFLFGSSKPLFLDVLNKDITVAYLCPKMINFDMVDFSECRSEEVISYF